MAIALCSAGARADPVTDGLAAYESGDYATAYRLWRPLAEEGLAIAQFNLGVMHTDGRGVRRDDAEAVRWYRRAAEQGHAMAQNNLGAMYADGRGVPQDDAEAVRWYRKAAEQGFAQAQFNLGSKYAKGRGVRQDYAEAVGWYRKAAEQGSAAAQNNLGYMYVHGQGLRQDYAEAVRWYRKAAEQGNAQAQVNLSGMYYLGRGVAQDFVQAHMWFNLAASKGHDKAREARDLLAKEMTPAQIAEAQRLAGAWQPRQISPAGSEATPEAPRAMTPDLVREAQVLLARLGFDPGPPDGDAGARTRAAVEAYQRGRRVPVDGTLTAALVERMRQDLAGVAAAPPSPAAQAEALVQTGSGFFVTPDGHLLTNAHVVAGCTRLQAREVSGAAVPLDVLATAPREDLALLRARAKPPGAATFRAGVPLRAGDDVVLFGFPLAGLLASSGNTSTGSVTALAGPGDDAQLMQISAPVQPGNSGGPVLDLGGSVVGVVVGKLDAITVASATRDIPQNVNFAIKASVAANFLEAHAVSYAAAPANGHLSAADIADRARRFTVRVECYR